MSGKEENASEKKYIKAPKARNYNFSISIRCISKRSHRRREAGRGADVIASSSGDCIHQLPSSDAVPRTAPEEGNNKDNRTSTSMHLSYQELDECTKNYEDVEVPVLTASLPQGGFRRGSRSHGISS